MFFQQIMVQHIMLHKKIYLNVFLKFFTLFFKMKSKKICNLAPSIADSKFIIKTILVETTH